jgi:hypothetical protein
MKQFITQLQEQLEQELLCVKNDENLLQTAEQSVNIIRGKLNCIREFVCGYVFRDQQEEIWFFKEVSPDVYSRLIYFLRLFNLESRKPKDCTEVYHQLVADEVKIISQFFSQNLDFYQYYKSGSSHLDDKYFLRGNNNLYLGIDDYFLMVDAKSSTFHSCKLAQLKAYESLSVYFKEILQAGGVDMPKLSWTASKTALIELIYAIQTLGVFNNGTSDLRDVAAFFERAFGLNLGNYYRTFQDIRIRKSGRTIFLDELKEKLIRRMDEIDENPKIMYSS